MQILNCIGCEYLTTEKAKIGNSEYYYHYCKKHCMAFDDGVIPNAEGCYSPVKVVKLKHYYIVYFASYPDEDEPQGVGHDDVYCGEMDLEQIQTIADIIADKQGADNVIILNWKEIP